MMGPLQVPGNDNGPPPKLPFWKRFGLSVAGTNAEFVRKHCPEDIGNLLAGTAIALGAFLYNATIFSTIAVRLFGEARHGSLGLVLGAIGLAGFILTNDSYIFYRCSYLAAGLEELKRAGLDIDGLRNQYRKMRKFFVIRIGHSCALGLVLGVMVSLLVYAKDISSWNDRSFLHNNTVEVQTAVAQVDSEIKRATDTAEATKGGISLLNRQIGMARQAEINSARRLGPGVAVTNGPQVRVLEARRIAEEAKLTQQKEEVSRLQRERNSRIREQIAGSPTALKAQNGILGQINALEEIAGEDWKVAFFIFLIEICAVGFDLAPVLAKMMYLPTTYSALVARDYLLRMQQVVDDTVAPDTDGNTPHDGSARKPTNDNKPLNGQDRSAANDNAAPRRKRGRPRKNPAPGTLDA